MKEGWKSVIRAPLLAVVAAWPVPESDYIPRILLIVVNLFLIYVRDQGPNLQALKLLRGVGSATTRRRVFGGGLLSERDGSWSLCKLYVLHCGSSGGRATDVLIVLGVTFLTLMSHSLQKEWNTYRNRIDMLESKGWRSYERSLINRHYQVQEEPWKPDMSSSGWTCPVRDMIYLVLATLASENVQKSWIRRRNFTKLSINDY
jgi:hypothetical protein